MKPLAYLVILTIFLASCAHTHEFTPSASEQQAIEMIPSLMQKAQNDQLTQEDLTQIRSMIGSNEHALEELEEVEVMVRYEEYEHALHGLAFLDGFLRTGAHPICPAHGLAHYYAFMNHGEIALAEDALAEAKSQMEAWKSGAQKYDEQFPGVVRYDAVLENIQAHMGRIDAGDSTATSEEIRFLANEGSLCVEGEHSHDEEHEDQ